MGEHCNCGYGHHHEELKIKYEQALSKYNCNVDEAAVAAAVKRIVEERVPKNDTEEIKKFLLMLFTGEKYPFSTPELRKELSHTMWYLNRVASAKALHKLMREDEDLKPLFDEYEVVLAAGDGKLTEEEETRRSYDRVKEAIATHEKTITLTVGQLTHPHLPERSHG